MSEVTSNTAVAIEPGTVQLNEWDVVVGRLGEETQVLYRGSPTVVPDGWGPLIAGLARTVDQQAEALNELALDPDVALPEFTRDEQKAVEQVAEIAVDAVIERNRGQYGTPHPKHKDADTALRLDLIAHFAELLGHYSRRTAQLLAERHATALLLQDARQAEWEAAQSSGYWHKRCTFTEEALLPFAEAYDLVKHLPEAETSQGTISLFMEDVRQAHRILAEMRKSGSPGNNYEEFVRDNRQTAVATWAQQTFATDDFDPMDQEERAFRFLEEALELWQSVMHGALTEANGSQSYCLTRKKAELEPKQWMMPSWIRLQRLINRVLSGDPGEIKREYGGVMVTLLCLAEVTGHSVVDCEKAEFARVKTVTRDDFQARHQVKRDAGI